MQNNADFRDLNEEYLGSQNRFKRAHLTLKKIGKWSHIS